MFYIYEGSVDPERDICIYIYMYCVGCLVCWPAAVALVGYFARFPSLSLSFRFFFINFLFKFPIIRRLPPDETRASFRRRGRKTRSRCRSENTRRFRIYAFVHLCVSERACIMSGSSISPSD